VEQPYVYIDVVFLINFFMDYLILWATARLLQVRTGRGRLALGALVGATYSVFILFPDYGFLFGLSVKFAYSLAIVAAAFFPLGFRRFLQAAGYFYLVSFTMGGAMLGGVYLLRNTPSAYQAVNGVVSGLVNLPYWWLVVAAAAAYFLGRWGSAFIRRNFLKSSWKVPVVISFGNRQAETQALVDTGNRLTDPLTRVPVMIAEYRILEPVLPLEMKIEFEAGGEPDLDKTLERLARTKWSSRVRLIPFSSIGKHHGMLLGLRPDEVVINYGDRMIKTKEVIVGIYSKQLCPKGSYRALLPPDLLQPAMNA